MIIVTGAAGFIGSCLVSKLNQEGYKDIVLVDNFSYPEKNKNFEGKTLVESKIRQNYSLNIVALQKKVPYISEDGKSAFRVDINDCPMPMDIIEADDIVVLVGSEKNFNKLFSDLQEG